MKIRDLLDLIALTKEVANSSEPYIVGGIPRDRMLGIIKDSITDIDITTGDKSVHYLAKEFYLALDKRFPAKYKRGDDGHITVFSGDIKIDFSSNFIIPEIEKILLKEKQITNPTELQKEAFSRDFTCNTLLMTLDFKKIKDITKESLKDLDAKVLRTCLPPEFSLGYNHNRIPRIFYLASKLDFEVDQNIISWVRQNPRAINTCTSSYVTKNLNKSFEYDPEKTVYLLNATGLWDFVPYNENLSKYWKFKKQ